MHPGWLLLGVDRLHHRSVSAAGALGGDDPSTSTEATSSGGSSRADQARIGHGHLEAFSSVDRQPKRLVEMSCKITGITSMCG